MARLASIWGFFIAVLVTTEFVVTVAALFGNMEPRFWDHELKKTYCQLIQHQRIYRQEELHIYCAGKVAFFDEMVNLFRFVLSKTEFKTTSL